MNKVNLYKSDFFQITFFVDFLTFICYDKYRKEVNDNEIYRNVAI